MDEVLDVFESVNLIRKEGFRDYTILNLLYDAALRASELAELSIESVNQKNETVGVRGKGNKYRLVQIWPRTTQLVGRYLVEHRVVPKPLYRNRLFINQRREGFTRHGIHRICRKYLKKILTEDQLKKMNSAHCFRHSCAVHMLAQVKSISDIKNHLEHEDIKTTMIYLKLDTSRKKEIQERFIEYTKTFLKTETKIDELIDWDNKEDILNWLDSL